MGGSSGQWSQINENECSHDEFIIVSPIYLAYADPGFYDVANMYPL